MFFVIDDPGDRGGVESVFIDQYAARPHARRHRISADADFSTLEVLRMPDAGIRTDQQAAVVEATSDKNRQRDERRAVSAGNDVGRWRDLAHVEFDVTDHSTVRGDLRNHLNEIRRNAFDANRAIEERRGVRIARNCDVQFDVIRQDLPSSPAPKRYQPRVRIGLAAAYSL